MLWMYIQKLSKHIMTTRKLYFYTFDSMALERQCSYTCTRECKRFQVGAITGRFTLIYITSSKKLSCTNLDFKESDFCVKA